VTVEKWKHTTIGKDISGPPRRIWKDQVDDGSLLWEVPSRKGGARMGDYKCNANSLRIPPWYRLCLIHPQAPY
jgi:hypothetical protein